MSDRDRATYTATNAETDRATAARPRRGYVDWLRGLAVVIMIEAHTFDAWTASGSRVGDTFWYVQFTAGWGAPIFLFLAGLSVALASGSALRKGTKNPLTPPAPRSPSGAQGAVKGERGVGAAQWEGAELREGGVARLPASVLAPDARVARVSAVWAASRGMQWRGLQIWGLALLFRVQAWLLSPGATLYGILKVDILNIMGPAVAGAAIVWGLVPRLVPRIIALCAVAAGLSLLTPIVRHSELLVPLPDPLEWYFRPWPGRTTFTLFPWAGFVFVGAAVGSVLDRVRDAQREARLNLWFGLAGVAIALVSFAASFLPSPYAASAFWTSSPCFFFLRAGVMMTLLALAYLWSRRPVRARADGRPRLELLQQFGRTSLFIYWIHVEMVYGFLSYPLHKNLTLPQMWVAFLLFTGLMYWLSVVKTRVAAGLGPTTPLGSAARSPRSVLRSPDPV